MLRQWHLKQSKLSWHLALRDTIRHDAPSKIRRFKDYSASYSGSCIEFAWRSGTWEGSNMKTSTWQMRSLNANRSFSFKDWSSESFSFLDEQIQVGTCYRSQLLSANKKKKMHNQRPHIEEFRSHFRPWTTPADCLNSSIYILTLQSSHDMRAFTHFLSSHRYSWSIYGYKLTQKPHTYTHMVMHSLFSNYYITFLTYQMSNWTVVLEFNLNISSGDYSALRGRAEYVSSHYK